MKSGLALIWWILKIKIQYFVTNSGKSKTEITYVTCTNI